MRYEIIQIGLESHDQALKLLKRFFVEEDFIIPADMAESLRKLIEGPATAVFTAQSDGKYLGVATVTSSVGLEYSRSAELEDLYILPEARGYGIASSLIEAICAWGIEHGCTTLLVTITKHGESQYNLTEFYQRRNFINSGRIILERFLSN